MKFSKEQQEFIDNLINSRVAEIRAKAEARTPVPEELMELKRLLSQAHDRLRLAGIRVAAAELGAISAEQVALLLDLTVKADDSGSLYVVNAQGQRRFLPDGKPTPVDSHVSEFLTANPHLVKASVTTGAGSRKADAFWGIFQNK